MTAKTKTKPRTPAPQAAAPPAPLVSVEDLGEIEEEGTPLASLENQPDYFFDPQSGIGSKAQLEIQMMLTCQLVGITPPDQGAFRNFIMKASYREALSGVAQRHMKQLPASQAVTNEDQET